MKYKCLIFDHDDTTVNSTATIHHPCFQLFLDEYFPGRKISLEEYFIKNFAPGFVEMCREEYGMDEALLEEEVQYWRRYVKEHVPVAYPGIKEIMDRQKAGGGLVCVISHSMSENIYRDFAANGLPVPDRIYGWEQPPERRKPNPWPMQEIMKEFNLQPRDILMIDDLKPGYDMAMAAGTDFAGAGWAYNVGFIESFMRNNCSNYFKTVDELKSFLLD